MLLALKEMIRRHGNDELQFFQEAYFYKFQKHADMWNSVAQYRLHGVIPKFVEEYVKHLEGKDNGFGF